MYVFLTAFGLSKCSKNKPKNTKIKEMILVFFGLFHQPNYAWRYSLDRVKLRPIPQKDQSFFLNVFDFQKDNLEN
ncbi:hypothetical protein IGJ18_001531 [Enterococcus sp. AZ078]